MRVKITGPQSLNGTIHAPSSKSYTHRALFASLLTHESSLIYNPLQCDDTKNTINAIRELGGLVRIEKNKISISGPDQLSPKNQYPINCGDSGTTFRLLAAIAATSPIATKLTGSIRLGNRPHDPLLESLKELGASTVIETDRERFDLTVTGPLGGGETSIPGNVSSQFISGLLFASPLAKNDVTIHITGHLESSPYVEISLQVLAKHGIKIIPTDDGYHIPAPQYFRPTIHHIPGDFSSTAFMIAGTGITGHKIAITGLNSDTVQPDAVIMKIANEVGMKLEWNYDEVVVARNELQPFSFDAKDNPDLVPALQVLACFTKGESIIKGIHRLRYKETDRLETVPKELAKMGAKIHIDEDVMKIQGIEKLVGANLDSYNDHRVAMACSIASLAAKGNSIINHADAVSKSYPEFYTDLTGLGVELHVE